MSELETTLRAMSDTDLRTYAKGNNVSVLGMSRESIIAAIIRAERYTGALDTTVFASDCQ